MTREHLGTVTFVFLLLATCGVTFWVIERIAQPKSQLQEKLEEADLVRYYLVDAENGPTFELRGNDRVIKLITHAELPKYDKKARILYGFRLRIRDASGHSFWESDIYTRTRQSKDGEENGVYRFENTFGVTSGIEYGDDRMLEIRLPREVPSGSLLEIRLLGASDDDALVQRALVRAYRQIRRGTVSRQLKLLRMGRADRRNLSSRVGIPWDLIPGDQQWSMLAHRWERMAAMGEPGIDFSTRLVFYSGYRSRPEEEDEKEGIHIHALHYAAINVLTHEPVELTLHAMPYSGEPARCRPPKTDPRGDTAGQDHTVSGTGAQPEIEMEIDMVSDDGVQGHRVTVSAGPNGFTSPLPIPAGLHSLRFRTDSPMGAVFCLTSKADDSVQFGDLEPIPFGDDLEQLIADARSLPVYLSDSSKQQPAVSTYIDGPPDVESRTFLIEARSIMSGHEWLGEKPVLEYRFLDQRGNLVGRGSTSLAPMLAPFEKAQMSARSRARQPETDEQERPEGEGPESAPTEDDGFPTVSDQDPALAGGGGLFDDATPGALAEPSLQPISEPMRFPLIAPESARHLEVTTSHPSLLRILGYLDERSRYDAPYCDYLPAKHLLWRYAPRQRRRWFPTRPENRALLADTGRIWRLRAQVRLEARATGQRDTNGTRVAVPLEPERPPERQLILEPVADEQIPQLLERWPVGTYTKLSPGTKLRVSERSNKRPKLRYLIRGSNEQLLGMSIEIQARHENDAPITLTRRLSTPRGIWSLPYLPRGESTVECKPSPDNTRVTQDMIEALKSSLDCYVDLPPAGDSTNRIVRARTVYPLDHRTLRLIVQKKPGRDVILNAVIYDERITGREDPYIYARVDHGQPRRSVGVLVDSVTQAERWWPLPPASSTLQPIFVDLAGRTPGLPRTVSMRLGDDLTPGKHVVEIKAPALSGWARFYTYDVDPKEQESAWQWQFEAPDVERGSDD